LLEPISQAFNVIAHDKIALLVLVSSASFSSLPFSGSFHCLAPDHFSAQHDNCSRYSFAVQSHQNDDPDSIPHYLAVISCFVRPPADQLDLFSLSESQHHILQLSFAWMNKQN
jgi:hypothetical protein